jgi:Holliday junction resolvase RusA-like endonuclease
MFKIDIDIDIVPKERARINKKTGAIYTPQKTRNCMKELQFRYKEYMRDKMPIPKGIPIRINFIIWITHNAGDFDNLMKTATDSGNKILWSDDKQVISGTFNIHRVCKNPRLLMEIEPLENYLGNEN